MDSGLWLIIFIVSIFSIGTSCLIIDIIYYGEESVTIEYIEPDKPEPEFAEVILIENEYDCII